MTKSAVLKQNQGFLSTLPVGVILAWHRDLNRAVYIPTLPPGWVECNGQKLDDSESPFHGQDIPNLNGDQDPDNENSPGLSRKEQMFLRGGAISGEGQDHQMQSHTHEDSGHTHPHRSVNFSGTKPGSEVTYNSDPKFTAAESKVGKAILGNPTDSRSGAGTPLHGLETRPANMSIIWIMKVKQVVSARATPVVQAADNAPPGAIYVGEKGNLGIGTATPGAKLQILDGQEYISLRVGRGDAAGNDFTMDVARGQGLANLVAGAKIKPDGTGYTFLGTRGASRIRLHDGLIDFHTSDKTSGVANQDADGLSVGSAKMTLTHEGNVGIGTTNPQAQLHVAGDLLGAARDVSGNALRICCGKTPEGATNWQPYGKNGSGIYIVVDISPCDFKSTPIYIVNMHGNSQNWETTGGSSAYARTEKNFTIYVRFPDARALTPDSANSWGWHIQWIAIGT